VRACYAAALAIYLLAFSRPRFREPAIVTTLPPGRTGAQQAVDARRLRFLCDALVVRSTAECEAVVRHGFPIERVAIVPAAGAVISATREVYLEARAGVARRAQLHMSYMF
jgi:hypothetical protein